MPDTLQAIAILIAEDDEDDRLLAKEAFREAKIANPIHFVTDGEQLMDYLHRRQPYQDVKQYPWPGLILLDLNMPRKDGREALAEIKGDPTFRRIPIVVLTTSKADEDVVRSYDLGVNSFITKPVTFNGMVDVVRAFSRYWFGVVTLPVDGE